MANLLLALGIVLFLLPRLPRWAKVGRTSRFPTLIVGCTILVGLLVAQIGTSTFSGVENARTDSAKQIVGARIATNPTAIPVSARQELVTTYLFPAYPSFLQLVTIARQDQLGEFTPKSYVYYRAMGPPLGLVPGAIATVKASLASWCTLAPGDLRSRVYDQMGAPHGGGFARWGTALVAMGYLTHRYAEWDVGDDMLIADFRNGRITTLQAFAAPTAHRATDIPCSALRN